MNCDDKGADVISFCENIDSTACGTYEREDSSMMCGSDIRFEVGSDTKDGTLLIGGDDFECDSEWGSSFVFNISQIPQGAVIENASLSLFQLSYTSTVQVGVYIFSVGVDTYILRGSCGVENAVALFTNPEQVNYPFTVDVTSVVQEHIDNEMEYIGFLLVAATNAVGTNSRIIVADSTVDNSPQLIVRTPDCQ